MNVFEAPHRLPPSPIEIIRRFSQHNLVNGFLACLFAATGPLVILLNAAREGGLDPYITASWIFSGYAIGGFITLTFSIIFRQPIAIMWTIPGAVLIGTSLNHLSFSEIIGAYIACGALLLLLAITGSIRRLMEFVPFPIMMAMVAGVFLPFALGIIDSFRDSTFMAFAMILAYLFTARIRILGAMIPPIVAALLAGAIVLIFADDFLSKSLPPLRLAEPVIFLPQFTVRSFIELAIPLLITVVGIQNAQGFAILRQAGYYPAQNTLTMVSGVGTLILGIFGCVPACVTGPANALLNASGKHRDRYISGIVFGILAIGIGLYAPYVVGLGLALPTAYIVMLAGLAMFPVLKNAFVASFKAEFTLGALTTFIVTLSDITILNVSAPFWALVFGIVVSLILEKDDFKLKKALHRPDNPSRLR